MVLATHLLSVALFFCLGFKLLIHLVPSNLARFQLEPSLIKSPTAHQIRQEEETFFPKNLDCAGQISPNDNKKHKCTVQIRQKKRHFCCLSKNLDCVSNFPKAQCLTNTGTLAFVVFLSMIWEM